MLSSAHAHIPRSLQFGRCFRERNDRFENSLPTSTNRTNNREFYLIFHRDNSSISTSKARKEEKREKRITTITCSLRFRRPSMKFLYSDVESPPPSAILKFSRRKIVFHQPKDNHRSLEPGVWAGEGRGGLQRARGDKNTIPFDLLTFLRFTPTEAEDFFVSPIYLLLAILPRPYHPRPSPYSSFIRIPSTLPSSEKIYSGRRFFSSVSCTR